MRLIKKIKTQIFGAFIVTVLALSVMFCASAETPTHGKLPDGRAYRVDENGNEIVDYIAELELEVDALKRQVHGLQYELEQKQQSIARNDRGKPDVVSEKTLIDPVGRSDFDISSAGTVPRARMDANLEDLREELLGLQSKHERERAKLETEIASLQRTLRARLADAPVSNNDLRALRDMLDERDLQILALKEQISKNQGGRNSEADTLKKQFNNLSSELRDRDRKIAELNERLELDKQVSEKKLALLQSEVQKANAEKSVIAAAEMPRVGEIRAPTLTSRAVRQPTEPSRDRALESIRGRMLTQANRVRSRVATRESFFNQYRDQGRPVTFRLSPLVAGSGKSLAEVTDRIKAAKSVNDLAALHRDLTEIENRIKEDTALIERLGKAR